MTRKFSTIISAVLLLIAIFAGYKVFATPEPLLNYEDEMGFLVITLFLCIGLSFGTLVICLLEVISMKSVTKRLNSLHDSVSHLNNNQPLSQQSLDKS